jgi:hypothetical protein
MSGHPRKPLALSRELNPVLESKSYATSCSSKSQRTSRDGKRMLLLELFPHVL